MSGEGTGPWTIFVVCPPGLEEVAARELVGLGVNPDYRGPRTAGGWTCRVGFRELCRLHLHAGVASRVWVRAGHFEARTFDELVKGLEGIAWWQWLKRRTRVEVRAEAKGSALYHEGAIVERAQGVVQGVVGEPQAGSEEPGQRIFLRVVKDRVQVSLDASGEHLHKRGYRVEVGKAPLRETLAAGLLAVSGWDGSSALMDPFCGSGTIPIEAARKARGIPPGWDRTFGFMGWKAFDEGIWAEVRKEAEGRRKDSVPLIVGSDRDAGAIRAARANAARAGVGDAIEFREQAVSRMEFPVERGWVVTNPPYGTRVGGRTLRDLYAAFGNRIREDGKGWTVAMISASREMQGYTGLPFRLAAQCKNGGIPVAMVVGGG